MSDVEARVSRLYETYQDRIYRFLQAQGLSPSVAQEMTQDVFVDLFVAIKKGAQIESERAWLYTVANRTAADHWRRERTKIGLELDVSPDVAADVPSGESDPAVRMEHQERLRKVAGGLQKLPRERRLCLQLRIRGLRYREIAEILHVSTSTVAEWLVAATDLLRREADG